MKKVLLFLSFVFLYFSYSFLTLWNTEIKEQDFIISRGDTLSSLPDRLDLSLQPSLYKLWMKSHYPNYTLQVGSYSITENTTLQDLFENTLKNPVSKDLSITLLPGWNIYDMDTYLSEMSIIRKGDFIMAALTPQAFPGYEFTKNLTNLEGFLMPDTYRIKPTADAGVIIDRLLQEFEKKIWERLSDDEKKNFYDTLILASIVEREEKIGENKPLVAGILEKRLHVGMPIGADATICYAYKLTHKQCTPKFINEHIYDKIEYNTRNTRGLPPTPISNISSETFFATLRSTPSDYYYYLHDNSGNIHYGRTLEEHNINKRKYIR